MKMTDGQSQESVDGPGRARGVARHGEAKHRLPARRDRGETRDLLRRATMELFGERGVEDTAVDDIVRRAGVAKGTFYLYFKSKAEILADIVAARSRRILANAMTRVENRGYPTPQDGIVLYVDELVTLLRRNKRMLELIYKNLSWGLYKRLVAESKTDTALAQIKKRFWEAFRSRPGEQRDPEKILFVLIELTSSLCYSAIVLKEPADMDTMRPVLLDTVRRVVS